MSDPKKVTEVVVKKLSRNATYQEALDAALGQNLSSSTLFAGLTTDDATMHGYGHALEVVHTKFKAHPPTATSQDEQTAIDVIIDAQGDNAGVMQGIVRKAARDAGGNVGVAIDLVKNANYKLKSAKSPVENTFKAKVIGSGEVEITTKAVAVGAGYVRQFGSTSAKGIPPEQCQEMLFSNEVDIVITFLRPGIYGIHEASFLPISRKSNSGTQNTQVEAKATPSAITKAHKRIFVAGGQSNYNFGEWIYFTVT